MNPLAWFRRCLSLLGTAPMAAPPVSPADRPRRISDAALAGSMSGAKVVHPFRLPQPSPGVLPASGAVTMAADAAISENYAWAETNLGGYGYSDGFLGYSFLAELAQRPEYRRMSETVATEMTRKWVRLHGTGTEDSTVRADRIKALTQAMLDFKVADVFRRSALHNGLFGIGQIYIDTGATNDPATLTTPMALLPETWRQGRLRGFRNVEPQWTYPANYNSSDPLAPDFYRPTGWYVMGKQVHATRLLTLVAREVPDLLKPAYSFGGVSLTQLARPYVENWLRTRQSVSDLIHSFSVSGLKTNMASVLGGEPGDDVVARTKLFNQYRDNRGMMLVDKDTEEFFNVSTPLSTLDHLQAQSQEQMASVAGIPLVKLLGITPSGLNASSEGEIRVWYDWIEAQQEQLFTAPLITVLQVLQLHLFGEIDPEIGFSFEPLWQMDDTAKAVVRKTNADSAAVMIDHGILSPEEERQRLAAEEGGLYQSLDVADVPAPPEPAEVPEPAEAA